MGGSSAVDVIDLWEAVEGLPPVERPLALAAAAEPNLGSYELSHLPLGRRDARLLQLRPGEAGRPLEATATCPRCGEECEFSLDVDVLLDSQPDSRPPHPVELDGYIAAWRSPDSRDVAAAAETGDPVAAERVLLERCIESVDGPSGPIAVAAMPAVVREAVALAMGDADPLAEVLVDLVCPACETEFATVLDLASYVWAELNGEARRLMREVAVLARAYGWTEAESLSLGEGRRAAYLELAEREGR
jgi:hypothetical protein